jgi:hypothetical protein
MYKKEYNNKIKAPQIYIGLGYSQLDATFSLPSSESPKSWEFLIVRNPPSPFLSSYKCVYKLVP